MITILKCVSVPHEEYTSENLTADLEKHPEKKEHVESLLEPKKPELMEEEISKI